MSTSPIRPEIASPFAPVRPPSRPPQEGSERPGVDASPRDSVALGAAGAPLPEIVPSASPEDLGATSLGVAHRVAVGGLLGLSLLAAFGCSAGTPVAPSAGSPPEASIATVVEGPATAGTEGRVPIHLTADATTVEAGTEAGVEAVSRVGDAAESQGLRSLENLEIHDAVRIDVVRASHPVPVQPARTEGQPAGPGAGEAGDASTSAPGGTQQGGVTAPAAPAVSAATPNELSPFGVDVGDGLFFDINGNLTFNPLRVKEDYHRITVDPAGLFNSTTVTRKGDQVRIDPSGLFDSTVITQEGDKTIIDPPGRFNHVTVTQHGGQTTVAPFGISGFVNPTQVVEHEGRVTYNPPGLFNHTTITQHGSQTRIAIPGWGNDVMTVEKTGDTTRIAHPGWGNDIVITRSGNRTVIDPFGWGNSIVITRTGNTVRVDPPGLMNSVTITFR